MPALPDSIGARMNIGQTIDFLRQNGLTYCGRQGKLEIVHQVVERVEAEQVPGIFLEAGVAMGGSASVIIKAKRPERRLKLYDVFRMLPPPSANDDPKSHEAYQYFLSGKVNGVVDRNYVDNAGDLLSFSKLTMQKVGIDVATANVEFIKGLYEDTLNVDEPVAFAHIDCDWHDSVKLCIDRIAGHMSPRGVMLFDDYNSFSGCRKAVDAWLAADKRFRIVHADWTVAVQRLADAA
jgi:hypothetical protein